MNRLLISACLAVFATSIAFGSEQHTKGPDPIRISHGAEVQLTDYLVPGKTTVFDFTSEYCPPCRAISPKLDALHRSRDDIAVVKIDLNRAGIKHIDWQSPVASEFHIQSIPQFKIFGPNGKLVAEGDEATDTVQSWVK